MPTDFMNELYSQIVKMLKSADDIALYCHTNPDCDALSSMLALYLALKKMGKKVSAHCDCPVPEKYLCLPCANEISFPSKGVHSLAVSVDCASIDRLGQCMKSFLSARKQIAIDHHKSFARFAETCLVDASSAACAQIIYKLIKQMKGMDDEIASVLFAGIVTDSGCFQYSNVNKETHAIACELLDYKFNSAQMIYNVFRSQSKSKFLLKQRALARTKFFEDDKIALIVFTKEDFDATNTDTSSTEGIIAELIDITSVQVAYALCEVGTRNFKLSIRTKDGVDAADIAMTMGGGGHVSAAGCRINGYLEDVIEKIIKLARDRL